MSCNIRLDYREKNDPIKCFYKSYSTLTLGSILLREGNNLKVCEGFQLLAFLFQLMFLYTVLTTWGGG